MNIGIVGHPFIMDRIMKTLGKSYIINWTIFDFKHENELNSVSESIAKIEHKLDGLIFTGIIPFQLITKLIPNNIPTVYIEQDCSQLQKDLFRALLADKGDIYNISIDSYDLKTINQAYGELEIDKQVIHLSQYDYTEVNFLEKLLAFHEYNYIHHQTLCITAITLIKDQLKEKNIPAVLLVPTEDSIKYTYDLLMEKKRSLENEASQIVVISIEPDIKSEYDLILQNEYQHILQKNRVHEVLSLYAQKIKAAIVNTGDKYLIFSTKKIVMTHTDNFKKISLLTEITEKTSTTVSIGIGLGKTAKEAKYQAIKSMTHAIKLGGNQCFLSLNDQLSKLSTDTIKPKEVNTFLLPIADEIGLGLQTLSKLYNLQKESEINVFTSNELAEYMNIKPRSMNRIIQKLMDYDYVSIVGKSGDSHAGRPKRLLALMLDKNIRTKKNNTQ